MYYQTFKVGRAVPICHTIRSSPFLYSSAWCVRYVRTLPVGAKNNKLDRLSGTIGISAGNDDFCRVSSRDRSKALRTWDSSNEL